VDPGFSLEGGMFGLPTLYPKFLPSASPHTFLAIQGALKIAQTVSLQKQIVNCYFKK